MNAPKRKAIAMNDETRIAELKKEIRIHKTVITKLWKKLDCICNEMEIRKIREKIEMLSFLVESKTSQMAILS